MMFLFVLRLIIRAFDFILLAYCVFSWFIRDPSNSVYRVLASICDPILDPFRKLLSRIPFLQNSPIDFSPVALMLVLSLLLRFL